METSNYLSNYQILTQNAILRYTKSFSLVQQAYAYRVNEQLYGKLGILLTLPSNKK